MHMYHLNSVSQKFMFPKDLRKGPFRKLGFVAGIKLRSYWIRRDPYPMTVILIRGGNDT